MSSWRDTCQGLVKAVETLRRAFPDVEVVTVAGNHEYYGTEMPSELEAGRVRARELGVHLVENDVISIGTARVVGCTLWTDYCLFGAGLREAAMHTAADGLMDHKRIKWRKDPWAVSAAGSSPAARAVQAVFGNGTFATS